MNRYNFDVDEVAFDVDQLIERLEDEHGKMIVRIPKMARVDHFIYEFTAIFSDYSLLEAKMLMIPKYSHGGFYDAEIHVHGVYL